MLSRMKNCCAHKLLLTFDWTHFIFLLFLPLLYYYFLESCMRYSIIKEKFWDPRRDKTILAIMWMRLKIYLCTCLPLLKITQITRRCFSRDPISSNILRVTTFRKQKYIHAYQPIYRTALSVNELNVNEDFYRPQFLFALVLRFFKHQLLWKRSLLV